MNPIFGNPDEAQHLIEGIRGGRYSLLLGAGFSTAAKSQDGRNLPTAPELVVELTREFNMPPGHALPRLWGALPSPRREAFLEMRFKECVVTPGTLPINRFVWRGIWNLNVDDVVEKIYSAPNSLQKLHVFSPKSRYSTPTSLNELNCVHLHGSVLMPEDGFVFSTHDYGALTAKTPLWGSILADELAIKPFIVIGSSLDEYDIEHYLELRSGLDASREPIPSFWVTPVDDPIIRATAQRYGFIPVLSNTVDFLRWLRDLAGNVPSPIDLVAPKGGFNLYKRDPGVRHLRIFHRQFLFVQPDELPTPLSERNFLHGLEPTWADLEKRHDVLRHDLGRLMDAVKSARDSNELKLLLVTSPPGSGKTTLLMRAALELAKLQLPVYFFVGYERLNHESAAECLKQSRDIPVVFVDPFADHTDQLIDLFNAVRSASAPCVIIGAERDNDLRRIRMSLGQLKPERVELSPLTKPEAAELVEKMRLEGLLGRNAGFSNQSLAERINRKQLIVAMCEIATDVGRFDQIVRSQWSSISDDRLQRCLAAVALTHSCGYQLKIAIAGRSANIDAGIIMREIGTGSLSGIVFRTGYGAEYLTTAHRVIAERLLLVAIPEEERLESYVALAKALARYVSRDTIKARTVEARLGGRLLDFDAFVHPKLGSKSRILYERIKTEWSWNSRYWEQLSLLELNARNYDAAIVHAEHAVGIEEHPFTLTTLGHVLVTVAAAAGDYTRACDYFDRGVKSLKLGIARSARWHFLPVHPYHSAITGAIRFLRKWQMPLDRQTEEWVSGLLTVAIAEYPRAFSWKVIENDWNAARSSATSRGRGHR